MSGFSWSVPAVLLAALACGASPTPAESPKPEKNLDSKTEKWDSESASSESPGETSEPKRSGSNEKAAGHASEPQFTDQMSVEEATNAVPQGLERTNVDQDTLSQPLNNVAIYESCKPGGSKLKVRVGIWNGRAVGVDITTTPKNEAYAECVEAKLRALTWPAKVRTLNTIEYQF